MWLSVRQMLMLRLLMKSGGMNLEMLSKSMEVSQRTVFREIASVNEILQKSRIHISLKKSFLTVDGEGHQLEQLNRKLADVPERYLLTPKQKDLFIAAQLLLADDVCKAAFFSYQMDITAGAVSLHMNRIEPWLRERGLALNRKRGYGIAVDGTQWNKRNAFVTLIYEYKPVDRLLPFLYGAEKDPALQYFFHSQFGGRVIRTAEAVLNLAPQEQGDDIAYLTSLLHTMISVKKMMEGRPIPLPEDFVREARSAAGASFDEKLRNLLSRQNIPAEENEIAYIVVHLPGNYLLEAARRFQGLNVTVGSMAKEVLDEIQAVLGDQSLSDSSMLAAVSRSISLAIYRADMGIHVKNTLLDQVREHYGPLFCAVDHACKLVFSKYNLRFSPNEIASITMEIGGALETKSYLERNISILILCPNGLFASQILSDRLRGMVRPSDSITVASLKEWSENKKPYDLVISTIPVKPGDGKNSRILVVSQFLSEKDIARIHESVDRIRSRGGGANRARARSALSGLPQDAREQELTRRMIDTLTLRNIPAEPFADMVWRIAADLLRRGIISSRQEITRLILQREKIGSVVIPGTRVSLLHIRSDLVASPFVGVYRIRGETKMKGVGFVREPVDTFLIMLARNRESPRILEKMGSISVALIEDPDFPGTLRSGGVGELRTKFIWILTEQQGPGRRLKNDGAADSEN